MSHELRLLLASPWRNPELRAVYWWAWAAGFTAGVTLTAAVVALAINQGWF